MKKSKVEDVMVKQLSIEKGRMNMTLSHSAVPLMAKAFLEYFKKSGGVNYVEFTMHDEKDIAFGEFNVMIQRANGKTAAQIAGVYRAALEKIRDSADKKIAAMAAEALKAGG